jgi:hypothetical protein
VCEAGDSFTGTCGYAAPEVCQRAFPFCRAPPTCGAWAASRTPCWPTHYSRGLVKAVVTAGRTFRRVRCKL